MKILDLLASLHNSLSDKDFIWWPFSFLRPKPQEDITLKLAGLMTACFGGLSFVMFTVFAVVNNALTFDSLVSTFFFCFVGFGLWFNIVTRPVWNYRARKLRA